MKRHLNRLPVFVLTLAIILGFLPTAALAAGSSRDQFITYAASKIGCNGAAFGFGDKNWCVYFINYCAKNNGTDISALFPDTGSVTTSAQSFAEKGAYFYFDDSYIPKDSQARKQGKGIPMDTANIEVGDLAYFISNSGSHGFEHIGIVEKVNSNGVTIVHGSWSNKVVRTDVTFGKTIGTNYPVRFCGIAKPDYGGNGNGSSGGGPTTKTQYRYHRYITSDGRASLCPYYGQSTYDGMTLTLEYTDWLDSPLTVNGTNRHHENQGKACTSRGCIDPTCDTDRYTDGTSNWYYQETRTVEIPASTEPPAPKLPPNTIISSGNNPEQSGTANQQTQKVLVDGKEVSFQMYSLSGNGGVTNYIKLRDLAAVLNGTDAQFNVTWSKADGVGLETGKAYTPNGTENKTAYTGVQTYQKGNPTTNVNTIAVSLENFTLQNGAYTYYKLRDLGQALGFNVGYDGVKQIVFIETNKPYDFSN